LNKLRLKADLANKEEFYFRMQNSKMEEGKHIMLDSEDSDFDDEEFKKIVKT